MSPHSQTSLPSPSPPHPSTCCRAPVWVPWDIQQIPMAIYFTHGIVNFYVTLSIHLPFSLLSSHLVHRSVLYVCFSIAALKINLSMPSLQIPYICISKGEGNGTPTSTLAWKIPWAEEPGRLQSTGSWRVGYDWATSLSLFTFMHWRRKWQPTPVFLPGESQGRGSLVGCRVWGCTESDTNEVT